MGYSIEFEPDALRDWFKLQAASRERFKKMLAKRLENPRIASAIVSGFDGNGYLRGGNRKARGSLGL